MAEEDWLGFPFMPPREDDGEEVVQTVGKKKKAKKAKQPKPPEPPPPSKSKKGPMASSPPTAKTRPKSNSGLGTSDAKAEGGAPSVNSVGGVVSGQLAALLKSPPAKDTRTKKRKAADARDSEPGKKGNATKPAATKKVPTDDTSRSHSADGQRPSKVPKPPNSNQASPQRQFAPRSIIFRTVWLNQPNKVARGTGGFPGGASAVEAAAAFSARSDYEFSVPGDNSASGSSTLDSSQAASWVVVALSSGEQLCGLGSVRVTCLRGRLDVSGLILDGRDYLSSGGDNISKINCFNNDGRGCTVTVHAAAWHGAVTLKALAKGDARGSALEHVGESSKSDDGKANGGDVCSASGLSLEYPAHVLLEALPEGPAHNLLTCAGDGQDATRLAQGYEVLPRRRSLVRSGAAHPPAEDGTGADTDDNWNNTPQHATSTLALPGWCVLAGEEDEEGAANEGNTAELTPSLSLSSTTRRNQAAVAAQAARAAPVLAVPSSWQAAADAVVHAHLRHLNHTEASLVGGEHYRCSRRDGTHDDAKSLPGCPVVCLVVGAKGVGKSSAVRYLVHRLVSARRDWLRAKLEQSDHHDKSPQQKSPRHAQAAGAWRATSVSLLDLDVGQPEMAPPGLLSLHTLDARLGSRRGNGGGGGGNGLESADNIEATLEDAEKEHVTSEATLLLGPPHTHLAPSCGGSFCHSSDNSGLGGNDSSDSANGSGSNADDIGGGAYFFGDVTPRRDPALYLAQVASLAASHRARLKQGPSLGAAVLANLPQSADSAAGSSTGAELVAARARATLLACGPPLVANGDGWVSGLGSGVLASLLRLVRPSHVVALHGVGRNKQFTLPTQSNAAQDFLGPDAAASAGADASADSFADHDTSIIFHEDECSNFDDTYVVGEEEGTTRHAAFAPPLWVPSRTIQHSSSARDSSAELDSSEAESSTKDKNITSTSTANVDCVNQSTNGGMVWGEVHVVDAWNAAFTEAATIQNEKSTPMSSGRSSNSEQGGSEVDVGHDGSSIGGGGQAGSATATPSLPPPNNTVVAPTTGGSSAADLRSVRTAAYFALLFQKRRNLSHEEVNGVSSPPSSAYPVASGVAVRNGALSDPSGSLAHALAEMPPLRAPLHSLALVAPGDLPGVPALASTTELLHAFNGALVALLDHRPQVTVQVEPKGSGGSDASAGGSTANVSAGVSANCANAGTTSSTLEVPPCGDQWAEKELAAEDGGGWLPPPGARCVGLGIVRSIDLDNGGWVYLLTPAPASSLRRCAALARAPVGAGPGTSLSGLPPQLLLDPKASAFPYLFCEALTTGGGAIMKSRNNLLRGGNARPPQSF